MMERLLRNNIAVKIFAFILAVTLWAYVAGDILRTNVPEITRTYRNVPLSWLNMGEQLEIMRIPGEVDVLLIGRSDILEAITPQNIKAFVDLRDLGEGRHQLAPNADVPRGVRILSFNPQHVVVELEVVESPQMPVSLDILGSPADGFVMGEPRILPNAVFVRGPRSILENVSRVRAVVNIEGATSDRIQMVPVMPVDAGGREVEGVRVNPSMIEVLIPFSEPQKTVPVRVPLDGEPSPGYRVRQVNIDPATITLQGPERDLAEVTEILTESVSINGLTENFSAELLLIKPAGLQLLPAETVRVEVEIIAE